jgi:hypothetical protein
MAKAKRGKKKAKLPKRKRVERRFLPELTRAPLWSVVIGMLGAAALGAGVWAQWITEQPYDYAGYLVGAGAVVLSAALWLMDPRARPVRVGDAGVAVEKGSELTRLAWCDLERVSIEGRSLVLKGADSTLTFPMIAHPQAAAWVLAEAARRVHEAMDVKPQVVDSLPKPKKAAGELVPVEAVQITGRLCAKSGKAISLERDARLCPLCGQVYHQAHVPTKCVTCHESLGRDAIPL